MIPGVTKEIPNFEQCKKHTEREVIRDWRELFLGWLNNHLQDNNLHRISYRRATTRVIVNHPSRLLENIDFNLDQPFLAFNTSAKVSVNFVNKPELFPGLIPGCRLILWNGDEIGRKDSFTSYNFEATIRQMKNGGQTPHELVFEKDVYQLVDVTDEKCFLLQPTRNSVRVLKHASGIVDKTEVKSIVDKTTDLESVEPFTTICTEREDKNNELLEAKVLYLCRSFLNTFKGVSDTEGGVSITEGGVPNTEWHESVDTRIDDLDESFVRNKPSGVCSKYAVCHNTNGS